MIDSTTIQSRRFVRGALFLGAIGLIGVLLFVIAIYPPTENSFYPKCTLHQYTGLHCPGCGLTRSVYSLLHGNIHQSLAYNVLWPILLPLLLWGICTSLWNSYFPNRAIRPRLPKSVVKLWPWALMALMIAFGILRNIPAYPFELLAPHELTNVRSE